MKDMEHIENMENMQKSNVNTDSDAGADANMQNMSDMPMADTIDISNISDKDKINIIDKIIDILPEIKKKRAYIINELITSKNLSNEHVVEKIFVNGKSYYKDKYKRILNNKT